MEKSRKYTLAGYPLSRTTAVVFLPVAALTKGNPSSPAEALEALAIVKAIHPAWQSIEHSQCAESWLWRHQRGRLTLADSNCELRAIAANAFRMLADPLDFSRVQAQKLPKKEWPHMCNQFLWPIPLLFVRHSTDCRSGEGSKTLFWLLNILLFS